MSKITLIVIELEYPPYSNCILKAIQLAKILNDFEYKLITSIEKGGYLIGWCVDIDRLNI